MRTFSDVDDDLTGRGVAHEILHLPSSSRTAALAAAALDVPVAHVVKSLLFMDDQDHALLALVPGDATVDVDALRSAAGCGELRLAKSREVRELTGYRPGAVPPCALATEIPVVADPAVFSPEVVYCGGGATTAMLKIRSRDLEALAGGRQLTIAARG